MFRTIKICNSCVKSSLNFVKYISGKSSEKWDLFGAICVERKPIVVPQLNEIESKFAAYLEEVEFEKSMKSVHEIRHEIDLYQAEKLKKGDSSDIDLDSTLQQTAQDFEDACVEELAKFKFASKVTEADKKNDTTSLNRKLDRHLVLLVQQNIGKKPFFLLPQVLRNEGETMRQTAERALQLACGETVQAKFFGNAPSAFYKYRYPKTAINDSVGAKIFVYMARYINGNVSKENSKYKWLDRLELERELPQEYYRNISKCLIDDVHILPKNV